jgi:hypothetical protein
MVAKERVLRRAVRNRSEVAQVGTQIPTSDIDLMILNRDTQVPYNWHQYNGKT